MSSQIAPVIAGKAAGKRIRCATLYQPAYNQLKAAALRGSHWPRIAIHELEALSSGLLGKKNVYLRPGGKDRNGNPQYFVFLPGLLATVVRWPNDDYCITRLAFDANYFEAAGQTVDRLGLYRAEPMGPNNWNVEYVSTGEVLPKDGRMVAIANAAYGTAADAVQEIIPRAMNMPGVPTTSVRNKGCDLHFTPGKSRLGSLARYSALADDRSRGSALYLAQTMAKAKSIEDVVWVADKGGSVVLTQAMQILADKGVTLEGHSVYLYKPSSSPGEAVRLAHRLKLTMNDAFADTGFSPRGAVSQLLVSRARMTNDSDPYSSRSHDRAWINGMMKAAMPAGIVVAGAAAFGASIPMLGGIVAAISTGGAMFVLGEGVAEDVRHKLTTQRK